MRKLSFAIVLLTSLATGLLSQPYRQSKNTTLQTHSKSSTAKPSLPPVPLPEEAGLYAVIYTSMGNIVCRLYEAEAPKTVAVFRGLATGAKPWKDPKTGRMRRTPLYNGTIFHRVIPDFMIQGGDPKGDGTGGPGFEFANETPAGKDFSHPGVMAMANSGPDTNGCQFFITVAAADHLNGKYSIFGQVVTGQEVADAISKVPKNEEDRPDAPVTITAIAIRPVAAAVPAK